MKLAIMQPYFFPYIGYFSLIEYADKFVFFDTPQYISRGWINRNRILTLNGEPTYITVPVEKAPQETPIREIMIDNSKDWRGRIYGQLSAYKRRAPRYSITEAIVHDVLDGFKGNGLSELSIRTVKMMSDILGLKCEYGIFSGMKENIVEVKKPDEWALEISKALEADVYVNPPGGMSFFDRDKYRNAGIEIKFLQSNLRPYRQRIGQWVPALSVIDVLMFCDEREVTDMLKDYALL